jgi:CII-binding regulator of phage lambda lysogenization HflD
MLSFEFTQAAFESELEHATKVIYLNSFLTAAADTLQKLQDGYIALRDELKEQSELLKAELDNLSQIKIVEIELKLAENSKRIDDIKNSIKIIGEELDRRAQAQLDESKKLKWIDVVGTIGKIATLIPEPTCQAIGAGLVAGTQFYKSVEGINNFSPANVLKIVNAGSDAVQTYNKYAKKFETTQDEWKKIGKQWSNFIPVFNGGFGIQNTKKIIDSSKALVSSLSKKFAEVQNVLNKTTKVPDGELGRIKSNLLANDPRLAALNKDLEETSNKHRLLVDEFNATNDQIFKVGSEIAGTAIMFDNTNEKISTGVLVLDHRTVHYVSYLKQNALRRLKMYHYFMAKAFEFRRLQPYTGNLNVASIYSAAEKMVSTANSANLNSSQYEALASIYRDQISQIAEDVYKEYTSNFPPLRKVNRSFVLDTSIVNELNSGNKVKINLSKIGLFNENEENIRIVGLRVATLKGKTSKGFVSGTSPEIKVAFTYPNQSKIRYRGKVYYFNNYNTNT